MARRVLAVGLAVVLGACGGGGGAGGDGNGGNGDVPAPTVSFTGLHLMVRLKRFPQGDEMNCLTAQATMDAGGNITFTEGWSESGYHVTDVPGDWSYQLLGGQAVRIREELGESYLGAVSIDGQFATATDPAVGNGPKFMLFAKRDPSPQQFDLTGDWHYFQWGESSLAGRRANCTCGAVSIDAAGRLTFSSSTWNLDGELDPLGSGTSPSPWDVLVGPDGWVRQQTTTLQEVFSRGALSVDHDLLVFGPTRSGNAGITLLVRYGQSANDAALDGAYFAAGFSSSYGPFACDAGRADLDGQGGGTWARTYNEDGSLEDVVSELHYSVAFNGGAQVRFDSAPRAAAAVGPSGRYVVWGGYLTAGSTPAFDFLFR